MFGHHDPVRDAKRLVKDDARRQKGRARLAEDVAGELHDLEKLRDDLRGIKNELLVAKSVGRLPGTQGEPTCAAAVTELQGIFLVLAKAHSNKGRLVPLRTLGEQGVRHLENDVLERWHTFRQPKDVLRAVGDVLDSMNEWIQNGMRDLESQAQELNAK